MKLRVAPFICSLAAVTAPLFAADVIPAGYPAERYEILWQKSPFTLASVATEQAKPGFAESLVVTGVARIGDEDFLMLFDKKSQERLMLSSTKSAGGIELVTLNASPDPLKTTATVRRGGETAVVRYDPSLLTAPGAAQAAARPGMPGQPNMSLQPGMPNPGGIQPPTAYPPAIQQPPVPGGYQPVPGSGVAPGGQPIPSPARRIIRRPIVVPNAARPQEP